MVMAVPASMEEKAVWLGENSSVPLSYSMIVCFVSQHMVGAVTKLCHLRPEWTEGNAGG